MRHRRRYDTLCDEEDNVIFLLRIVQRNDMVLQDGAGADIPINELGCEKYYLVDHHADMNLP